MSSSARKGPLRPLSEIIFGLSRSIILIGLTCVIPAVGVIAGWGGSKLAYSWSAGSTAPLVLRALALLGETLVVLVWIAVAVWIAHNLTSRALSKAARKLAGRWLGMRIQVTYRAIPPVTRMATGYWWDGHEYHKSEREARRRAKVHARFHDPQLHWDGVWALIAGVTVLPVASLPLLAIAGGVYLTLTSGLLGYGVAVILAGLAIAPFAWRIFGPVAARFLGPIPRSRLGRRVEELEAIRADLTQTQAAELERIERGLHDGAQARLVAMGMSMQAAEQLVDADPLAVKAILADARASSVTALTELRSLVRGISPPVLAERGLVDAIRALALDSPIEVTVHSTVPSRPERPVESAVYFAVAELLANVAKHAQATRVTIDLDYANQTLTATVTDNGIGIGIGIGNDIGAAAASSSEGSGLDGIERRMMAFDGRLKIDSPAGGPTRMTVTVPCVLS